MLVVTFGDSILDCGRYNDLGVTPGDLIVRNQDDLFPEFRGRDLAARGAARLEQRAIDGSTVTDLAEQLAGLEVVGPALAMVTIGGNDLMAGLAVDEGSGVARFGRALEAFLAALPIRPVLLGNVYDPTFGDDRLNFLGVDATLARTNLRRINAVLAELAPKFRQLIDLHAHFLTGEPGWYTRTIEPSLIGASEVRRVFLDGVLQYAEQAETG